MTNLTPSVKLFSSLSRTPGAVWIEATKRKAPHNRIL
jgi:putative restriction endonuclease